jgi:hypothetical protein
MTGQDRSEIRSGEPVVARLPHNGLARLRAQIQCAARPAGLIDRSRRPVVLQVDDDSTGIPGPGQQVLDAGQKRLSPRHRPVTGDEASLQINQQQGLDNDHVPTLVRVLYVIAWRAATTMDGPGLTGHRPGHATTWEAMRLGATMSAKDRCAECHGGGLVPALGCTCDGNAHTCDLAMAEYPHCYPRMHVQRRAERPVEARALASVVAHD